MQIIQKKFPHCRKIGGVWHDQGHAGVADDQEDAWWQGGGLQEGRHARDVKDRGRGVHDHRWGGETEHPC